MIKRSLVILALFASSAAAQVCSEQVTLRSATCPAGTNCTTAAQTLTWAQLDADLANTAELCTAIDEHLASAHLPVGITWSAGSDCTGSNGGALTISGSAVVCSDDDGGGGGGGVTGSGTTDAYSVWTSSTELGDGRLSNNGNDLDITLPSGGAVEIDGRLRLSQSGGNAIINSPSGKTSVQVLGSTVVDVLFGGAHFPKGVVVSGGNLEAPDAATLPACPPESPEPPEGNSSTGAIHFDTTSPGAFCGCTSSGWVTLGGSGTCS